MLEFSRHSENSQQFWNENDNVFMYIQVSTNINQKHLNKNFICYLFKVLLGHRIMQSETFEMVMLLEIPVFSKRHKEANKEGFVHDLQKCYITLTFDLEN